jgi:hypothetical protein
VRKREGSERVREEVRWSSFAKTSADEVRDVRRSSFARASADEVRDVRK